MTTNGLWQFQDANIDQIRDWNSKQSSNYPHCSICLLFKHKSNINQTDDDTCTPSSSRESPDFQKSHSDLCISSIINDNKLKLKISKSLLTVTPKSTVNKQLPKNSEVLIPEMCFTKHSKTRSKLPDFQRDKIDCLLQCKNCSLTVHQSKFFFLFFR